MNPTYDFHGQVALITGAASGMGFATAKAFAEAGASVALADRPGDALETATERLRAEGHTALAIATDVSDEAQVAGMVARSRCHVRPARHGLQQRRNSGPDRGRDG